MVNTNFPHATTKDSITAALGYAPVSQQGLEQAIKNATGKILAEEVTDLDNPPNAMILKTGVNPVGFPDGLKGGNGCVVIQQNPQWQTYTAQLAFGFGNNAIALRRRTNTSQWTEWVYFYPTTSSSDESENEDMEML